jgi:hypothetical protein
MTRFKSKIFKIIAMIKQFDLVLFIGASISLYAQPVTMVLNAENTTDTISRHIYGNFSNILVIVFMGEYGLVKIRKYPIQEV